MRYLLLLFCISVVNAATAQKKPAYAGSVEAGMLAGSKPLNSFAFVTQGIQYRQYTFSAGSGIDFSPFRSVPVFADVKKVFTNKAAQPFVQVAAGINITNAHSSEVKNKYLYTDGDFNNGFFAKGGGGLLLRTQNKWKILLSAGYSYKTSIYRYAPQPGWGWGQQQEAIRDNYHFNSWYIGAGIVW